MILWVESQNVVAIGAATFAFCYALAAVGFGLSAALARHRLASDLRTLTPVLLTPLSVIIALLIAFLALSSSSRIAYCMTSSGIMEAISEGDRPVVARPAASANVASYSALRLFGVPF